MKKSIYLSLIALMFSVASFAQEAENNEQPKERKVPTVEEIAKRRADRLRNELLLGNDQYDKVYKLCLQKTYILYLTECCNAKTAKNFLTNAE